MLKQGIGFLLAVTLGLGGQLLQGALWAQGITFVARRDFAVGRGTPMAVGDFNNDGVPDLVVSTGIPLTILLGNGDGTFRPTPPVAIPFDPGAIAVGDLNGDMIADLVLCTPSLGPSNVAILLGNGNGTFRSAQNFRIGREARFILVGDFNQDDIPDVAILDGQTNSEFRVSSPKNSKLETRN